VRELKNTLEQALALCPADTITPEHLPEEKLVVERKREAPVALPSAEDMDGDEDTRRKILNALAKCAGNQTRAAKVLGTTRFALMQKL